MWSLLLRWSQILLLGVSVYPVDAQPTCDYALDVCRMKNECIQLYRDFKAHCRISDGNCKMDDWELCHDAWTKLSFSPMFGCICPSGNAKCERIFGEVNHNSCVGTNTTSQSGSITVQDISSGHAPDHDDLESQLETPLLGSHAAQLEQQKKPPRLSPSVLPPPPPKSTLTRDKDSGGRRRDSQSRFPRGITTTSSIRTYEGSNNERSQVPVPVHTSCYTVLQDCLQSPTCSKPLQNVLYWCDPQSCREEACMEALQNFYRGVQEHWALELAFCFCRRKSEPDQECLHAQGQLHPVCAQRGDLGMSPPSCQFLAESCRAQPDCNSRLLVYETACAVDSVSRKCAGSTAQCRNATIGILGTVLKKSCACNETDYTQLYDCLAWQRILWVNPCVLESQRDFHRLRPTHNGTSTQRTTTTIGHISTDFTFSSSTSISTSGGTATEIITTSIVTTTRSPTSSTQGPRYCVVRRPLSSDQLILEGTSRRLYREDKPSCSELCTCLYEEFVVSCTVITCFESKGCTQIQPDNTTIVYKHDEPLYQTGRRRCICYEGGFICVRPPNNSYNLNNGVFLFLGFSRQDESVLKAQTALDAVNVIDDLRRLIDPHFQHLFVSPGENDLGFAELKNLTGNGCRLGLFRIESENLIINATVSEEDVGNYTVRHPINELLVKEREKCMPIMKLLRDLVNAPHPAIHNHPLLSILKLADVEENNIPDATAGQSTTLRRKSSLMCWTFFLYFLSVFFLQFLSTLRRPMTMRIRRGFYDSDCQGK